jgi:hypothetical protein
MHALFGHPEVVINGGHRVPKRAMAIARMDGFSTTRTQDAFKASGPFALS